MSVTASPDSLLRVAAVLLACCIAVTSPTLAAKQGEKPKNEASSAAELKQVRARIDSIRQAIQSDTERRDALSDELQSADATIKAAREKGAEIRRQREASERKLDEQKRQETATEQRIAAQRAALTAELRVAYMTGSEEQLKLLLNQRDPSELGRMATYYGYFGHARAQRIATINAELATLRGLVAEIDAETSRLRQLEAKQQDQVKQLASARTQRARTLAAINTKLQSRSERLTTLQKQAATLEKLLEELRKAVRDFPSVGGGPPEKLRGKLPWPVKGRVTAKFGELRSGGPLRWEGILIESTPGATVRAPIEGRVVYADWLNGLGYLVVLDHGDGYLSLYGHNEQLYRKAGDRVRPGDVLGELAERADGKAELYLEFRKAKTPLDPMKWLSKP